MAVEAAARHPVTQVDRTHGSMGAVQPFRKAGVFWLPQDPGREIPGELRFDEDGVMVRLFSTLHEPDLSGEVSIRPRRVEVPILHGHLHGELEAVSVVGLSGVTLGIPFGYGHQDFVADAALVGGHLAEVRFDRCRVSFDCLDAWANPPPLTIRELSPRTEAAVRINHLDLATADVRGSQVLLRSRISGTWGDSVHLDQRTEFEVVCQDLALREILSTWLRPLGDLLVVCLGRPASITHLEVHGVDVAGDTRWFRVSQELVQRAPASDVSVSRVRSYDAPTLLLPDDEDVPFVDLVPEWFCLLDDVAAVVRLLCAPFYAPFIFSEHRYASTFQAAEALALTCFPGPEKAKKEHRQRVADIVDAARNSGVAEEHVEWAKRVLSSANNKRLRQLVEELLRDAGAVGTALLAAGGDVPSVFASARTGVSHGGAASNDALARYWLGQALTWVLRMHLVRELGVPPRRVESQVLAKPSFKQSLDSLRGLVA